MGQPYRLQMSFLDGSWMPCRHADLPTNKRRGTSREAEADSIASSHAVTLPPLLPTNVNKHGEDSDGYLLGIGR